MRLDKFFHNLQQDFKLFVYLNIILMAFRILFLVIFAGQIEDAAYKDILLALWFGFRISLKTAGLLTAFTFIFGTLPNIAYKPWPSECWRKLWAGIAVSILTLGFFVRIPYYKIFNSGFNLMLINGIKDDWRATYETAVTQYQLWPRVIVMLLVIVILVWIIEKILAIPTYKVRVNRKLVLTGILIVLPIFAVFVRFGGAFNFDQGIHWESAARMQSDLLNEAILDDGQAIYRTYATYARLQQGSVIKLTAELVKEGIMLLQGEAQAKTIEEAFLRHAQGAKLGHTPQQVVVIFGENNAVWPFLPRYQELELVPEEARLMESGNATHINNMLAGGGGTMPSLNTLVTGLPDAGLYQNYEKETFKTVYATGIGNIMKKLGYKTYFWYGGLSNWQDIKKFVLKQGFDEFHCSDELPAVVGTWGVPDRDLFQAMNKKLCENKELGENKVFHFVLTTSNHPPYGLDVDKEGFPRQKVASKIPNSITKSKEVLDQLGHIWYADKAIGEFISKAEKIAPDALFVITGDHAERFTFAREETLQANSAVPCIFYGKGVEKDWLNAEQAGTHIQMIPTLIELIAPLGFEYSSILPSLINQKRESKEYSSLRAITVENENLYKNISFNANLFVWNNQWVRFSNIKNTNFSEDEQKQITKAAEAARNITDWRVKKGNSIE